MDPRSRSQLPATQTAVTTTAEGRHTASYDQPVPACGPGSVLVRVRAVALNPTDHKTPARVKTAGLVAGCDFAGEVVKVGSAANDECSSDSCSLPRRWSRGDRVFGVVYGSNPGQPDWGAFANFVEADPVMLCRMPADWDWKTAASIGGSVHGSVALCLFGEGQMGLDIAALKTNAVADADPSPNTSSSAVHELGKEHLKRTVLVYGGSTACGTAALQILRLAGYIPIATCSPRNVDLVTSYGAAATFDYHSDACADEIKRFTRSSLGYALDCIGTAQSAVLCYGALGRLGGRYVALEKFPDSVAATRRAVRPSWVMGPVMFGRELRLAEGYSQPADAAARAFARLWYPLAEVLARAGNLRSHPIRVVAEGDGDGAETGWPGAVVSGLQELRDGNVSAQKLVVSIPLN